MVVSTKTLIFNTEETNVQGNRNFHILMMYSNYSIKTLQFISVTVLKIIFKHGIPEKLDSGRMVWTLSLWTLGRLDSGRLDSKRLGAWPLDAWDLDAWTQDDWALGLWILGFSTPECLDFGRF